MLGMGRVMTSSPSASTMDVPSGANDSTFAPRQRQVISPEYTGRSGTPLTNAVQTSVPPDADESCRLAEMSLYTHSKPSGGSGDPVDPMPRIFVRSAISFGVIPALRQDMR